MQPEIMRYEVDAEVIRPGVSAAWCKDAALEFDSSAGQNPALFGPAELLAAALAACVLKNVERFSQILHFDYQGARIHVTAERTDRPPWIVRLHYLLRVVTEDSPHRAEPLHLNIQRYGTITNTLTGACQVTGELVTQRPAVPAAQGGSTR
ncbi:MAG TPA: OsmC family protein [Actinomycetes bacterium]|jgi:uncharacterized OsmC-like protein|nr:OsmC family protein [Actinomycetes bacterium]